MRERAAGRLYVTGESEGRGFDVWGEEPDVTQAGVDTPSPEVHGTTLTVIRQTRHDVL